MAHPENETNAVATRNARDGIRIPYALRRRLGPSEPMCTLAIEQMPGFGCESDRMLKDPPRGYQTPNPARCAFPTGTRPILSARVGKPTPGRFEAQRMTDRAGTSPATRES